VSIDLVAAALWLALPPTRKLVLVSLCENADQYGLCWPSREYIAQRCSLSVRSVTPHLQALEEDGWLRVIEPGRRGFSTRRQLKAQRILEQGDFERRSFYLRGWGEESSSNDERGEVDADGGKLASNGGKLLHAEPSYRTVNREPSGS
jgi:DNA-binding transcriptional ArsR family regulator